MRKGFMFQISLRPKWLATVSDTGINYIGVFLGNLAVCEAIMADLSVFGESKKNCDFFIDARRRSMEEVEKVVREIFYSTFQTKENIAKFEVFETELDEGFDGLDQLFEPEAISPSILSDVKRLIGVEEFKALVDEIVSITPQIKKLKADKAFLFQNYLFSINDGCGYSTYLHYFAEVLKELDLFKFSDEFKAIELKLDKISYTNDKKPLEGLLEKLKGISKFRGIVSIDISNWINNIHDRMFTDILQELSIYQDRNILVFRIPYIEEMELAKVNKCISDVYFLRQVMIPPFLYSEMIERMKRALALIDFEIDEAAIEIFSAKICEEKSDGKFYGMNTVNKITNQMVYLKLVSNANKKKFDRVIQKEDIIDLLSNSKEYLQTGQEMMDSLTGMTGIKERIDQIVTQIEYQTLLSHENTKLERPCLHMAFTGNPGTGKTTVARIIGKLLKEKGILSVGNFYETAGLSLCGYYVGQTAPKVTEMCSNAYGSVLFIDEAYMLYKDEERYNYGKEVVATLISEMENKRDKLLVIFAGYTDEMKEFLDMNKGLSHRIPHIIEFPNFTREELTKMFLDLTSQYFIIDKRFKTAAKEFFQGINEEQYNAKNFSNGRVVRNLFERVWSKAAMRYKMAKTPITGKMKLVAEDIEKARSDKEFEALLEKPNQQRVIGFRN